MQYFVSILLHCREQPHHIISNAINRISHFSDYFSSVLTMRLYLIIFEKNQIQNHTCLGMSLHIACFRDVVFYKTQSAMGKKNKIINKGKRGKRQIRANRKRRKQVSHCKQGLWSLSGLGDVIESRSFFLILSSENVSQNNTSLRVL